MALSTPAVEPAACGCSQKGFTLIELLVTISILAILIGIAAPSFARLAAEQRLRAAAADLQSALLLTRSEAIKRRTAMTLAPAHDDWEAGWELTDPEVSSHFILQVAAPPNLKVTGGPAEGVVFRPSGRAKATATFQVEAVDVSDATKRCVGIELSGQAVVRKGEECGG
jgi:type IV fimbrial biogenesis protein FimT